MQVLVLGNDNEFKIAERPMPEPEPGEVLFRTHYAGICGSDLHAPMLETYLREVVLGHEFAGEVAAAGPDVDGLAGGRPRGRASQGRCLPRLLSLPQGMVQYVQRRRHQRVRGHQARRRYGGVCQPAGGQAEAAAGRMCPSLEGAWVEPAGVALRGVIRSGLSTRQAGGGYRRRPYRLAHADASTQRGRERDNRRWNRARSRRAKALELGADIAIDPLSEDLAAIFGSHAAMPEFVFECSGASAAADMAVNITQPRGCLTLIGVPY